MGCHFGVGAPPILVCFSGDWDVHWGYGVLTHGHIGKDMFSHLSNQLFAGVGFVNGLLGCQPASQERARAVNLQATSVLGCL